MSNQQLSYQIVINAYLREVDSTWVALADDEKSDAAVVWQKKHGISESEIEKIVVLTLPSQGIEIMLAARYWSLTLRHQFHFPILYRALSGNVPGNMSDWQEMPMSHFITTTMCEEGNNNQRGFGELNTLLLRCLLSEKNTDLFLDYRKEEIDSLYDGRELSFIESEQSLLIGHQLHPVAKSREGFSSSDLLNYSPETAEGFQLHYFAVDPELIHQDSALHSSAVELVKQQLRDSLIESDANNEALQNVLSQADRALLPVHPWQAGYLRQQSNIKALENTGQLLYLGAVGQPMLATTSIRTVFGANLPFMYKFSLNVRITNSERVNKSWELDRVVESARMLRLPVAEEIRKTAPEFEIVDEPAYISLKVDGEVLDGFSCILRDSKYFADGQRDISAVTSLVQDHPLGKRSRLGNIIHNLAEKEQRAVSDVALDWFDRYVSVTIEPLMKLFIQWGLCFEPHGQNTLVELKGGYPITGFCRDGQGFFHRQAAHDDWCKIIPHKGEATESIFPEDLARERLIYYPFINQVFSVINALGTQRLCSEAELMALLRRRMSALDQQPKRYPFSLLDVLENSERLPCKGNLLTQLYNMDELVGDIATQSVYVTLPNIYRLGEQQ